MKDDQASATAYTVLQGVLFTASKPELKALVAPEMSAACEQILSASLEGQKRLQQLKSPIFRAMAPVIERLMMPGITLHYVLRKRYIRDAAERAIAEGATQIINLGAGFDTLAWELHTRYPQVNFIELDHPATGAQKKKALFDQSPDNFHLLAVDFSQTDARTALSSFAGFDASRKTFYICEGVLMYLDRADVDRLFAGLKQLTGAGSQFVYTCVVPMNSADNNCGALLKGYLKFKNEPLNWVIEQQAQADFVQQQGYQLNEIVNTDTLQTRYLKSIPHGILHRGEYLVSTTALAD